MSIFVTDDHFAMSIQIDDRVPIEIKGSRNGFGCRFDEQWLIPEQWQLYDIEVPLIDGDVDGEITLTIYVDSSFRIGHPLARQLHRTLQMGSQVKLPMYVEKHQLK